MVAYNVQREHLLPSKKAKLSFNKARRIKESHEKGNLDEGTVLVIITDEGPPPQEMITFALSEAQNWLLHDRRPEQIRTEILNMLIRNVKKNRWLDRNVRAASAPGNDSNRKSRMLAYAASGASYFHIDGHGGGLIAVWRSHATISYTEKPISIQRN